MLSYGVYLEPSSWPTLPFLFGFDITHFHLEIFGAMPERMRNVYSSL